MKRSAILLIVISLYTFIFIPAIPLLAQELQLPKDSDRTPPIVKHEPQVTTAPSGSPLGIDATVTDNIVVKEVTLYYRVMGNNEYFSIQMTPSMGDTYSAVIPSADVMEPGLEYYIQASDKAGNIVLRGFSFSPLSVSVAPVLLPIDRPAEKFKEMDQETPSVEVKPVKKPLLKTETKPKAWYQNWVVWAVAGGVVVVAAAAGGGGGGGDSGGGAPPTGSISISGPLP